MNQLFIASFLLVLFIATPIHAEEKADEKRLNEVTERGSHVIPFDLEKTTHIFPKQTLEEFSRLLRRINLILNKST